MGTLKIVNPNNGTNHFNVQARDITTQDFSWLPHKFFNYSRIILVDYQLCGFESVHERLGFCSWMKEFFYANLAVCDFRIFPNFFKQSFINMKYNINNFAVWLGVIAKFSV